MGALLAKIFTVVTTWNTMHDKDRFTHQFSQIDNVSGLYIFQLLYSMNRWLVWHFGANTQTSNPKNAQIYCQFILFICTNMKILEVFQWYINIWRICMEYLLVKLSSHLSREQSWVVVDSREPGSENIKMLGSRLVNSLGDRLFTTTHDCSQLSGN